MRLTGLSATAHPAGRRIDLRWTNPDPDGHPGVRVVRRESTHPAAPDDGVVVLDHPGGPAPEGGPLHRTVGRGEVEHYRLADEGPHGGRVHYYTLFPYATPGDPVFDRANRAAALAASREGSAGRMYDLLPDLYRRYDEDGDGVLRRFLELPGGELDRLWSAARALLDVHDRERVDGRLLPLLAEWIGWKTDHRWELDRQRNEVRDAPALYRRVGMIPVVGATVKRVSGWESRCKEYVHNVLLSSRPPRLYLRARPLAGEGAEEADARFSSDHAHGGRAATAVDAAGVRWTFHHKLRRGRWELWCKSSPSFRLEADLAAALEAGDVEALSGAFAEAGRTLALDAVVASDPPLWTIEDAARGETYLVQPGAEALTVYRISADPLEAAPSRPFLDEPSGTHDTDPAAVLQGDTLWVFWAARDPETGRGEIRYRTRRQGAWSEGSERLERGAAAPRPDRRSPSAAVDGDGHLWLFWRERGGGRWQLRYDRYDPAGLGADGPDPGGWELGAPAAFPDDGGADPRVEADLFAAAHPGSTGPIRVFWARREAAPGPGQTRWTVAHRAKASLDPAADDWGPVGTLPRHDPDAHDREPAAVPDGDGGLTVVWASNREESWSVWRGTLDPSTEPAAWTDVERVTGSAYPERAPLPVAAEGTVLLLYRSAESRRYPSDVYTATTTVDFRHAGSTTPHVRDTAGLGLRGAFGDFQSYTHTARAGPEDRYRRDTVGVFLEVDTAAPDETERGIGRLEDVLPEFLPATDRAVFVVEGERHDEHVYTYERPGAAEPRFVGEGWTDDLSLSAGDDATGPDEDFTDDLQ